ncbi:MAG TPA: hypothetical protein VGL58_06330 [Caulobacteraceae bacterium]|jgi:hypothetical protein
MSPDRPRGPAFRASGGEAISRAGQPASEALFGYLIREALRRLDADPAAALVCASMALDLAAAQSAAAAWRRAGRS